MNALVALVDVLLRPSQVTGVAAHPPVDEIQRLLRQMIAFSFTDIAVRLSAGNDSQEGGLLRFCEKLREITFRWPDFARLSGLTTAEILSRIPTETLSEYWK
jgi:hypothetical protein